MSSKQSFPFSMEDLSYQYKACSRTKDYKIEGVNKRLTYLLKNSYISYGLEQK